VLRAAMTPGDGTRPKMWQRKIRIELEMRGLHKGTSGHRHHRIAGSCSRSRKKGIKVVDGQALMSEARLIKNRVTRFHCSNHSAMMVDARMTNSIAP